VTSFIGYHSEWNLGSPGGWDYQRITQVIGKAVWERLETAAGIDIPLNFDHPMLYPVFGFIDMLVAAHREREGSAPGLIAVVAEEETLEDVVENKNLAAHLSAVGGITGALMAPHELERRNGVVTYRGEPVSLIFMDFNTDVLLKLHRKHDLTPVLQAVREGRVINPRGTEPINVKSMFEVLTGPHRDRFQPETVARTPWTRQFYARETTGPEGEPIPDLMEYARTHWERLVLKPERGYSGMGVRVGGVNPDADDAIQLALSDGNYILQEKIPLNLWAEDVPSLMDGSLVMERVQTDFRCLMGPEGMFGFLGRYGGVPTNVGSGGGVQPIGVLESDMPVGEAVRRINDAIMAAETAAVGDIVEMQNQAALDHKFTYLLGPIKIALRPRVVTPGQLKALEKYCHGMWTDCLTLERMWNAGELDEIIHIEPEELDIARSNPWNGSRAIIASDGLFGFGAQPEE
jgi:hypothetical protein